jgi:hypothetical protein
MRMTDLSLDEIAAITRYRKIREEMKVELQAAENSLLRIRDEYAEVKQAHEDLARALDILSTNKGDSE